MNICKGDKIVLMREFNDKLTVGETYEVGNYTDKAVIIRDVKSKVALAAFDIASMDEYFALTDVARQRWTPWLPVISADGALFGYYRTNQKKVQYKSANKVRAESSCHPDDTFDLVRGINLAQLRASEKANMKMLNQANEVVNDLNAKLESIRHAIRHVSGKPMRKESAQ